MKTIVDGLAVASRFATRGNAVLCGGYGAGHINTTLLVATDAGRLYILQRINTDIFRHPDELMQNIVAVTEHLQKKAADPRHALRLVPTRDGRPYLTLEDGGCWRMYDFVLDGVCLQAAETPEDFYQSAVAFGEFQNLLADFPAERLYPVIPNFHNTVNRYENLKAAVDADVCGRVADVQAELDGFLAREETGGTLHRMMESGALPLRVTHNDTKLNNVMLDLDTRRPLCVIDLDTVMAGLSLYDFGDSIRFGASTAAEDERDLSRVELSLPLFETYVRGYLSACGNALTEAEKNLLPLGAKIMTLECGVRFLTDYLQGDTYFHTSRPGQNLDRARTQLRLVEDMERKWARMEEIAAREGELAAHERGTGGT